jgi:pyruvate formate lyase activating enzyme
MTVSGGEPLSQAEFSHALLGAAKREGLHTCVDTSGQAAWEKVALLAPVTDIFLYDLKETDPEALARLTGANHRLVMANLERLSRNGASIVLRCPIIPGINDRPEHLVAIGEVAERLEGILSVDLHPYHPLGRSKLKTLGLEDAMPETRTPEPEAVAAWVRVVSAHTSVEVHSG